MLLLLSTLCAALLCHAHVTETRQEYFARLERQRALDPDGRLAQASDAMRMLWRDMVIEPDTVHLIDLFGRHDALELHQAGLLIELFRGLGWDASFELFRCGQVECEAYSSWCQCRCLALAGNHTINMAKHVFTIHQQALQIGLRRYLGYDRGIWFNTAVAPHHHEHYGWRLDTFSCDHVKPSDTDARMLLRLDSRARAC